jgi:type VII secretion integral membrane protein EccD
MSTRTGPARLAGVGVEMCRLTVQTPDRRCDVALPVAASIGELLPLVVEDERTDTEHLTWVIQRLGGPPLDPGATPEGLGLYDGATLYVNPSLLPLPEAEFDDVSVGVAEAVSARGDQWRPEFSRYLLLGAAIMAVAVLCVIALRGRSHPVDVGWCVAAGAGLTVWAVLGQRVFDDRVIALVSGFSACVVGALAGLAFAHPRAGMFVIDTRSIALAGVCTLVPAAVIAAVGRLPVALFATIAAWAAAGALGSALTAGFGWTAAQGAAVLAVFVFAGGPRGVRAMLRFAGLRAPLLPRTAAELQEDIDPVPRAAVAERGTRVVAFLNVLFLTSALLCAVACVLLSGEPGWIGWTLAVVLSVAVLLRSAVVTSAWQRAPLTLAGQIGLAAVVISHTAGADVASLALVLFGILLGAAGLCAASLLLPGRRILPVWGHLADLFETWSAVALLPLLLQLFHVYAHIRSLIH